MDRAPTTFLTRPRDSRRATILFSGGGVERMGVRVRCRIPGRVQENCNERSHGPHGLGTRPFWPFALFVFDALAFV
jgi:hypothetical protein